jgi:protein involved in polysaccharide export with SLBB domain
LKGIGRETFNGIMVLNCQMKFFVVVLLLAFAGGGCTTRSQSQTDAQAAYAAGQRDAYARIAAMQRTSVVVIGPVQNPEVQWTEGLTLAQAILAANCTGPGNPKEIILVRQGETTRIDPKDLLRGHDVPLQPGDTITIHE